MPTSISEGPGTSDGPDGRHDAATELKAEALALGFDVAGIISARNEAADGEHAANLDAWLADGRHGDMGWMATRVAARAAPTALWPEARSVIALGMNYGPDGDPLAALAARDRGVISVYARGRDYHTIVKKRLKRLARWIVERHGCEVKVFVDTAPVMEKPLAARAGVGWQGRHTNLVSREFGSWLFLGEIYTTLDLPADPPATDRCGRCTRCMEICPTRAITAPGKLDPRRCISYLTIEHRGHIPDAYREPMGNRIYGCDDCLAVCPWNKFARAAAEPGFQPREGTILPPLAELAALDDAGFRARFAGSAVKRLGRDRFVRNVLIAIGNSGDAALATSAEARLGDVSPLVRAMAVWALARLAPARAHACREPYLRNESDAGVRAEWAALDG